MEDRGLLAWMTWCTSWLLKGESVYAVALRAVKVCSRTQGDSVFSRSLAAGFLAEPLGAQMSPLKYLCLKLTSTVPLSPEGIFLDSVSEDVELSPEELSKHCLDVVTYVFNALDNDAKVRLQTLFDFFPFGCVHAPIPAALTTAATPIPAALTTAAATPIPAALTTASSMTLSCKLKGDWYKPVQFKFFREFESNEALHDFLVHDEHHWNYKQDNNYTQTSSDGAKIRYLVCKDIARTVPIFHDPRDQTKDLMLSKCCWRAKVERCLVTGRERLFYPDYGTPNPFFEAAKGLVGAQACGDTCVFIRPLNVIVSDDGHVFPVDFKLRGCPPALKHEIKHLLQCGTTKANVKYELSQDSRWRPWSHYFDSVLKAAKKDLMAVKRQEPSTFQERVGIIHNKLLGRVAFNEIPEDLNSAMIVSDLFNNEVMCLVGTAASFMVMAQSSFLYSDATFGVMTFDDTKLVGLTVHDAEGSVYVVAAMQSKSENVDAYRVMLKLALKAKALIIAAGYPHTEVVRVTWDGFSGLQKLLIEIFGPDVARASCWFHVGENFEDHLVFLGVSETLRTAAKRHLHEVVQAPSAPALVKLSEMLKPILKEVVTVDGVVDPKLDAVFNLLDRMLKRKKEDFGFFHSFDRCRVFPTGPVAVRTTAGPESAWKNIKDDIKHSPTPPANAADMDVLLAKHIAAKNIPANYKGSWDVIFDTGQRAMKLKISAMVLAEIIVARHGLAGIPHPSEDQDARFFLLESATGVLRSLAEEDVRSAVGELVEERGAHRGLTNAQFKAQVDGIDGDKLLSFHLNGRLIQFHKDHPPGTARSSDYADCCCKQFRKESICADVLAVHLIYFRARKERGCPLTLLNEEMGWPTGAEYQTRVGVSLKALVHRDFVFTEEDFPESDFNHYRSRRTVPLSAGRVTPLDEESVAADFDSDRGGYSDPEGAFVSPVSPEATQFLRRVVALPIHLKWDRVDVEDLVARLKRSSAFSSFKYKNKRKAVPREGSVKAKKLRIRDDTNARYSAISQNLSVAPEGTI